MNSRRVPVYPDTAAASRLRNAIAEGDLFHAYLFEGNRRNNEELADWFTAAALCEKQDGQICGICTNCRQIADRVSPYVVRIRTAAEAEASDERFEKRITEEQAEAKKKPAGKSGSSGKTASKNTSNKIKDEQIEEVIARSLRSSLTGGRVFTVIDRAETITPKGQNRLLKTLEEPPEGIILILLTSNAEALLDTIRSRCMQFRTDTADEAIVVPGRPAFRKRVVRMACDLIKGTPAFQLWKEMDYFAGTREKASDFCETAQVFFRDAIMYQHPDRRKLVVLREYEAEVAEAAAAVSQDVLYDAVRQCETALKDLDVNVSMKHALRSLMLDIQLRRER